MTENIVRLVPALERMNGITVLPGDFDDLFSGRQQITGKGNRARRMPVAGARFPGETVPFGSLVKSLQTAQSGFGSVTTVEIGPAFQLHHASLRRYLRQVKPIPAPENAVEAQNPHVLFHLLGSLIRRSPTGEKRIHAEKRVRIRRRPAVYDKRRRIAADYRTGNLVISGLRGSGN